MIELRGLGRDFPVGDGVVHALADLDETIERGEHVAVMGPSGSGKSTLLNLLGCLDTPSTGTYRLDGRDVGALDDAERTAVRRDEIGFVFQSFHLVGRLDALQNVELPLVFAGVSRRERRERATEALAAVDLANRLDHRPEQLSGGERQRVAIARATILRPKILLADEPTGNLDTKSGAQVLDLLDHMHGEGLTLVAVTHDPRVAARAERILVLRDGRAEMRVPASEIEAVMRFIGGVEEEVEKKAEAGEER